MKIKVEYITEGEEELLLRIYETHQKEKEAIVAQAENLMQGRIVATVGEEKKIYQLAEILYFEYVEGKVFAYLQEELASINFSLEQLEGMLSKNGFVRTSKSVLMNLNEVRSLKSAMGNRMLATMKNGEQILISRHYGKQVRSFLKEGDAHGEI